MGNPYQPPKSSLLTDDAGGLELQRHKNYVILEPESDWPSRCIKCNAATDYKKKTKLVYVNPWVYLSILINILLAAILVLVFQKRFSLELPLCAIHRVRRKRFLTIQWIGFVLFVMLLFVGFATESPAVFTIAGVVLLGVIILSLVSRLAYIAKLKDGKLWVRGAGAPFLDSLPERR